MAVVMMAGLFQSFMTVVDPPSAEAAYATGGSGLHRGSIDWFEWGTAGQTISGTSATRKNTRMIDGKVLETTCAISSISPSSALKAYRSGEWSGDGLDDLYNVGGPGDKNTLVAGLANRVNGARVTFKFSCAVTLDGAAVPLQGLVVADAEQSDTANEYIEATPDQTSATWRIIDRYRDPSCRYETTARLTGSTLRLWGNDVPLNGCTAGPMAVAFMDGATSATVELKGAGNSAIALGVMLSSNDFGDAPASYGEAGALLETKWAGGTLPGGSTKVSTSAFPLATQSQSAPRLGAIVDAEGAQLHSPDAKGDDNSGNPAANPVNDEDAVGPLGTIGVTPGGSYTLRNVACTGPGFVAGWIDWNRNGKFDPGERSTTVGCTGSSVNLTWGVVPADTVNSVGENLSFLRLRIAADAASVSSPIGMSTSGEVEDHKLNIALPKLAITKTSNATPNSRPGSTITWTVRATNVGATNFTTAYPARLLDDLTGVLDDATYRNDAVATASPPGVLSHTSPRLSWTGALVSGASVTLTYSAILKGGGDGTARNVAWEPRSATNPSTPACAAPVNGVDATTGEACAEAKVLLPKLTVTKTADRGALPQTGTKVTYTVRVTNSGPGAYTAASPASAIDDLAEVLDAATYGNDARVDVGTVTYGSQKLSWNGSLAAGQSATITYSVTYTAGGDQTLLNRVCVPESERLKDAPACASVTILGANLTTQKSVSTPVTPARTGSVLTYTLRFANSGKSPAEVNHDDILTGVLDDATVGAPTATTGLTATRVGDRIRVTGSLPVNGTGTISYTATVQPENQRGDNLVTNFLVPAGAPMPAPCVATNPNCTSTPLLSVTAIKSVNPATGSAVIAGQDVSYTLTFTNGGRVPGEVDFTDDLSDVLDDALSGVVTVSPAGALDADVSAESVRITGSLNPSETASVSYTVTVKPDADRNNAVAGLRKDLLTNVLAPTGTVNPTCGVGLVVCTRNPVSSWTVAKTAVPATGEYVSPRDGVTYTVSATSINGDIRGAVLTDDLAAVLENANFVPGSAGLKIDGGALTPVPDPSNGSLTTPPFVIPSGRTAVLTYRVAVGTDAWSATLRNTVSGVATNAGAQFPPTKCFPGDEDASCSTTHRVKAHLFITKRGATGAVDGSAFEVRADVNGAPSEVTGMVMPLVREVGRFEASAFVPGDYWLVETRAPAGHTLLAQPVGFRIDAEGALTLAINNPQASLDTSDPQNPTIIITDVAALPLPRSGGEAVNFAVLAMVVIGIGAFGVVLIRRQLPQRPLRTG